MFVEHKEQGEVTEAPAKVMKLSEAIFIGAKLRPQGFGGVIGQILEGRSCALLAAYEAMEGYPERSRFHSGKLTTWAENLFGDKARKFAMTHNDSHRWSRENIAAALAEQGL